MIFGFFAQAADKPEIKEKEAFTYACLPCMGAYGTMAEKIGEFMEAFFKQGLQPQGGLISIYFNDPNKVKESELKWAIGFPVADETTVKAPLKKAKYEKKKVLIYLHKGSYELLPKIYTKLKTYIEKNGLLMVFPSYEFYLNNPQMVKPEELLTRIEIPVEKK